VPPPLKPTEQALAAYNAETAALHDEGLPRTLHAKAAADNRG
jgi:hypothetical protein